MSKGLIQKYRLGEEGVRCKTLMVRYNNDYILAELVLTNTCASSCGNTGGTNIIHIG